jgi:hypothetical protein
LRSLVAAGTGDWRKHLRASVRTCSKRSGAEPSSSKPGANVANVDRTMTMPRQWCVGLRPVKCKMTTSTARPIAIAPAT